MRPGDRAPAPSGAPGTAPELELRFDMGAEDAAVWERVAPAHRKRARLALVAGLFAGFLVLQALSGKLETVPGLHTLPAAICILLLPPLLVWGVQRWDRRRRAEAQVGGPQARIETRVEVWPDRVIEHRADRAAPRVLGARSLRDLRETGRHVLLIFGRDEAVILPARAFAGDQARAEFVARWRGRLR
ncbi:hypothetical protein [Paragemmobacter ruber]|nr:hypothetical protein [Rhodobacter ruber]